MDKVSLLESKAMLGRDAAPGFGIFMTPEKKVCMHVTQMKSSKDVRPVTAGPLIEEGLNAIHHLLAVLGSRDVQVHVAVPHVSITNHPGCTLPFQALLDFRILGYTLLP